VEPLGGGQGGEGAAYLGGMKVSKLSCYVDGYRYSVCRNGGELAEEEIRRESMLVSLQVGNSGGIEDERFRQRVEYWKDLALSFLPEIYILKRAIYSLSQRYFDGQEALFPDVVQGFNQLFASVEKLVEIYNEALADDIERLDRLLIETRHGQDESPLTIDLAGQTERVQGVAKEQVAYMVDMAKADVLN